MDEQEILRQLSMSDEEFVDDVEREELDRLYTLEPDKRHPDMVCAVPAIPQRKRDWTNLYRGAVLGLLGFNSLLLFILVRSILYLIYNFSVVAQ